jgi:hypothetical protein
LLSSPLPAGCVFEFSNVKTKSSGKQLLNRLPSFWGMRCFAEPMHSALDPPGSEHLMGEINIIRAEFSSAAWTNMVIRWQKR